MESSTDRWSPSQYGRFAEQRAEPFWDLVRMLDSVEDGRVVDLGCGTGVLTRELHRATRASETVGVDNSPKMLERSAAFPAQGLRFVLADVGEFEPDADVDLGFSNAALHWLPDHPRLFRRLRSWLRPGGQLAVQMPDNMSAITHRVAAEVGRDPRFAPFLEGHDRREALPAAEEYAVLLHELGFERQVVARRIYTHLLESRADVVEWFRGSLLTEYERLLPPDAFTEFLSSYRDALLPRLDDRRPYLLTFPRLLLWARLA